MQRISDLEQKPLRYALPEEGCVTPANMLKSVLFPALQGVEEERKMLYWKEKRAITADNGRRYRRKLASEGGTGKAVDTLRPKASHTLPSTLSHVDWPGLQSISVTQ